MKNYITYVSKTDDHYFRSHYIIHDGQWHIADFNTKEQLDAFTALMGFKYELVEERELMTYRGENEIYRKYSIDREFDNPCCGGFWKVEELPENAKPFKALSNGSIVDCYFWDDGAVIHIRRPNPNAKEVYKPLSIDEHIKYCKTYGTY